MAKLFRHFLAACLLLCTLGFVAASWRWPLVGDAALLHYVVFLAAHGLTPYRDIPDLNLPGALFAESTAVHLLGPGALAWRMYDFGLLAAIAAAAYALCRPSRLAALYAAGVFALIHGRDGLIQTGQRDLLMAALLAPACALLLRPGRASRLLAGLCLGAACTVKPSGVLFALVLPAVQASRLQKPVQREFLSITAAGIALPLLAAFAYLLHTHALGAFLQIETHLAPFHAALFRLSPGRLAAQTVSSVLLPVFLAWLLLFVGGKRRREPKERVLLTAFACGVLSFWVQGRGYPYHRYPSEVFLLLLAALAFTGPRTAVQRAVAAAGLVFGACVVAPKSLVQVAHFTAGRDPLRQALSADLATLGARGGQVQCLDMAGGCIATLYHARLTEATGFLYDCYLYPETIYSSERDLYRAGFRNALRRNPPQLIVATSDECGPADLTYSKLTRWPWLAAYLAGEYRLIREYRPTEPQSWGGKPALPYGYRIYRRVAPEGASQ